VTIAELGSIGELIGAVATVATLLYLAIQIRANTLATKRQSLDDLIDKVITWESRLSNSPDLMRSWISGSASYHELKLEDRIRFSSLALEILAGFETNLEAAKFGGVKPETTEAVRSAIGQLFRNNGIQEYWEISGRITMAEDFVREVDSIVESKRSTDQSNPGPLPFHIPAP
jgi:hypothetical protein